jgi:hypothetical protein
VRTKPFKKHQSCILSESGYVLEIETVWVQPVLPAKVTTTFVFPVKTERYTAKGFEGCRG